MCFSLETGIWEFQFGSGHAAGRWGSLGQLNKWVADHREDGCTSFMEDGLLPFPSPPNSASYLYIEGSCESFGPHFVKLKFSSVTSKGSWGEPWVVPGTTWGSVHVKQIPSFTLDYFSSPSLLSLQILFFLILLLFYLGLHLVVLEAGGPLPSKPGKTGSARDQTQVPAIQVPTHFVPSLCPLLFYFISHLAVWFTIDLLSLWRRINAFGVLDLVWGFFLNQENQECLWTRLFFPRI